MPDYSTNIVQQTMEDEYVREVLSTAPHSQLTVMTLQVGEKTRQETHDNIVQFIRVEAGQGEAILNGERYQLGDGDVVVIPAETEHSVVNTSNREPLRL